MDEMKMSRELPAYAAEKLPDSVMFFGKRWTRPEWKRWDKVMNIMRRFAGGRFMKRNGIALALIVAITLYGFGVSAVTERRVTKEVTEQVTAELRQEFQDYLLQQERDRQAANMRIGNGLEAAAEELADVFDELISTYAMDYGVNEQGLYTLGWVFIARVIQSSGEFGKTPQEIIAKTGAWEGKIVGHAVRNQDTQIALKIATDYLSGNYPDDFTTDITFGDREKNGGFVARNELFTGPNTVYWRYKG